MIRGQDETRGRIERERVVRLATIGGRGRAHVVPGVFGSRNLDRDQRATILAGFYEEDWPKVWRFRLHGTGRRESGAHAMVREVR